MDLRVVLCGIGQHERIDARLFCAAALQGFAPRSDGERRLPAEPGLPFLERQLVGVGFKETRPSEIVQRQGG